MVWATGKILGWFGFVRRRIVRRVDNFAIRRTNRIVAERNLAKFEAMNKVIEDSSRGFQEQINLMERGSFNGN